MDAEVKPQLDDLLEFSCFSELDEDQLQFMLTNASIMSTDRGEILFKPGDLRNNMYCLLNGRIKIGLTASSGNERVVDILLPGQTFGESALFSTENTPVYAQTMVQSRLLVLDGDVMIDAIKRWPDLAILFLELAHKRIQHLLGSMYACCLRNAQQRINDYLIEHAEPLEMDKLQAVVDFPASKSVIASSLNLSPETFSRQLHKLESEGVVRVDRHSVHVFDIHELRKRCLS